VVVIRNAVRAERFDRSDPADRQVLEAMFPRVPERIVGSAGRLSPEKGFGVLIEAAAIVARSDPGAGFIHFGDGPLRETIRRRIGELGLEGRFVLAGLRDDLDRFLPHWDLCVLPSFTEGLPTVVLESYAAGVPVVATAVGGTPEAVADGVDGYLVPPGDPIALARRILDVLGADDKRRDMGMLGRQRIRAEFTFAAQARRFQGVCEQLVTRRRPSATIGDFAPNVAEAAR
ncbi:MAG: glycosyltransferase, partial [Planctomycetaceae bacterium]|nr:glycosyltransferase [Planctomycetaceae bacterium]